MPPPGTSDRGRDRDRDRDRGEKRHLPREANYDEELERLERERKRARRSRSRSLEKVRSRSPDRKRRRSPDRSDARTIDRERMYRNRSRTRSASRERIRERDRERDRQDEKLKLSHPEGKKKATVIPLTDDMDDEDMMAAMMGFSAFDTSKGKKVDGNDVGTSNVAVKRKYRQYMNRRGGFNRPLDPVI